MLNVLVWVTSNRLRLTRETHAERADDIEGRLAVGEKTALATRFVHPHRHGDWNATSAAIDAAVGLLALGASVYVVYLLEIVKPANPFIRRREELARAADERRSA